MARDKYFNNHGRKNRFYAKGDLCRHEYIEKYYPIYDQARIPQLGRRWDKEKYYTENIGGNCDITLNNYSYYNPYCPNDGVYSDYTCACWGCCHYHLYHAFCYGNNKYYIYKYYTYDYHYYPHKYKHIDTKPNYCSRGCDSFKTCSHNIEYSELIYKIRKQYPNHTINTYYTKLYLERNNYRRDEYNYVLYFVSNQLIYINYELYELYKQKINLYRSICIYESLLAIGNKLMPYLIFTKSDNFDVIIYDIDKIFTGIWNRRRHAIIACTISKIRPLV